MSVPVIKCDRATLEISGANIDGNNNTVIGDNNTVTGMNAKVTGNNNTVKGMNAKVTGDDNTVDGMNAKVNGQRNTTTGFGATENGQRIATEAPKGGVTDDNGNFFYGNINGVDNVVGSIGDDLDIGDIDLVVCGRNNFVGGGVFKNGVRMHPTKRTEREEPAQEPAQKQLKNE